MKNLLKIPFMALCVATSVAGCSINDPTIKVENESYGDGIVLEIIENGKKEIIKSSTPDALHVFYLSPDNHKNSEKLSYEYGGQYAMIGLHLTPRKKDAAAVKMFKNHYSSPSIDSFRRYFNALQLTIPFPEKNTEKSRALFTTYPYYIDKPGAKVKIPGSDGITFKLTGYENNRLNGRIEGRIKQIKEVGVGSYFRDANGDCIYTYDSATQTCYKHKAVDIHFILKFNLLVDKSQSLSGHSMINWDSLPKDNHQSSKQLIPPTPSAMLPALPPPASAHSASDTPV